MAEGGPLSLVVFDVFFHIKKHMMCVFGQRTHMKFSCFLILKGGQKMPSKIWKILQYGESLVDFHTSNSNNQCNDDKKKEG